MARGVLSERQARFVEAYLASGNATGAARAAGYKHPNVISARLVKISAVKEAIKAAGKERKQAAWLTREERLVLLSGMATGVVGECVTDLSGEPVRGADGKPIEVPGKVVARIKAMELISRMEGELLEKREVSYTGDAALRVQVDGMSSAEVRTKLAELRGRNGA